LSSSEVERARNLIETLAKAKLASKDVMEDLAGALWVVERTFTRRGHLILEYLQNAEDAGAERFVVELAGDKLTVSNDGSRFTEEDVKALCSIGRSRKNPEYYLGYIGVGFKSTFLVSDEVHVYSWPYSFKFDRKHWPDPENTPWQITPIWIEEFPEEYRRWGTIFVVKLKPEAVPNVVKELEDLSSRVLLFTRKLKRIELRWNGNKRVFGKSEEILKREGDYYVMKEVRIEGVNNGQKESSRWLVFTLVVDVPGEVAGDPVTVEWKRDKVKRREVGVAFMLSDEGDLLPQPGAVRFGVFSYLPLREEVYDLPFIIHSDFLTGPGRETMHREAEWNKWLLKTVFNFIKEKIIPEFKSDRKWKFSYTTVLYGQAPHIINEYLANPLRREISLGEHYVDVSGSFVKSYDVVKVDEKVLEALGHELVEVISGRKVLHPRCKIPSKIPRELQPKALTSVLDVVRDADVYQYGVVCARLKRSYGVKWIDQLKRIVESLADEWRQLSGDLKPRYKDEYCRYTPLADEQGEPCFPVYIYIMPKEVEELVRKYGLKFRILHPLLTSNNIVNFLKEIGVRELTKDDVIKDITIRKIPELVKTIKDPSRSDLERIEATRELFDIWRTYGVPHELGNLDIPVKTKSSKWVDPRRVNVVFSREYMPWHRLEDIVERGFLDLGLEFLSAEYLSQNSALEEVEGWRKFFRGLGVERVLEDESTRRHLVERVGVKVAEFYERRVARAVSVRVLSESERGKGYDVESILPNGTKRCIEVKSSSSEKVDIRLTRAELSRLLGTGEDEPCEYYVYVVPDALKDPSLYVLESSKLRNIIAELDISIVIEDSKWRKHVQEPSWVFSVHVQHHSAYK